ncbi:MAG TPA: cytochrome c [Chromatiales bacterium]|nr:cytochrome c [Chromatiales bacterium]
MTKTIFILLNSFFWVLASTSLKAGDVDAGKQKAQTCAGCHGSNGIAAAPNFPNLAGQKRAYLIKAIKAYISGERNDPTMKGMVATLSDAEIEDLAAYFASLPGK